MVPNGWSEVKLGDVITHQKGFAFKSENYCHDGKRIIRISDTDRNSIHDKSPVYVSDENSVDLERYLLSEGDIILSTVGSRPHLLDSMVGKAVQIPAKDEGALLNQNLVKLSPKKKVITNNYLFSTLKKNKFNFFISTLVRGNANQVSITLNELFSYRFILPTYEEQRKIAQILSTWDRGIATTEKLIDVSKQQKKALMQQLLTGKKRLVDPETGKAFEGDWEEVRLEFLTENTISNGIYKTAESYSDNGNSAVLDINCVYKNNIVSIKKARIANITNNEIKKYKLEFGDILINRVSLKPDGVGVAALFNIDSEKNYVYESNLMRIRLIKEKANSEFINFILSSEKSRSEILMKANIGAQTSINQKTVNSLAILLPKFKEQQKIASVLTAADKEIELLAAKLAHFKQEKKALMQQLLTGKSRVKIAEMV